ncbi:MAG: hypothetical protein WAO02_09560 [Verrucomicrobiia bacterium]
MLLPAPAQAIPGDEHWDAQFGVPGTTNFVQALALNNGLLYAGGYGNPLTNTSLNVWNGNQWSVVGTFNNGTGSAFLYDAAFVGGTLYVAGMFSSVNGTAANGLARWDGNAWSSVGFSGSGLSLAVSGSDLYVGGIFTNLDGAGVVMTNIGRWDGSAWHALGGGLGGPGYYSYVRIATVNGGLVYAGGSFTNSGTQAATNLAVWNGSTWSAVGGGANGIVDGLAVNGGSLYAGGVFTQAGSTPANYIAKWDGTSWSALGSGINPGANNGVNNIAILNNQVCVAGSFTSAGGVAATNFAVWNGSSWAAAGSGLSAAGLRVVANGTNVYVGGSFGVAGGVLADGVAAWDGTNWSVVGIAGRLNGVSPSIFALANDGTNLYAGGLFSYAGRTNTSLIAKFDGKNWYPLGSGIGPIGGTTSIHALATAGNNVYAGGSFVTAGGVVALDTALWDGANWHSLGNGPGGTVAAFMVRTDGVYAVGAPLNGTTYYLPFFQRWDGTNWNDMIPLYYNITPFANDPNIGMDALATIGTNIYVGGHFIVYDNFPNGGCSNILVYGSYSKAVGTGLNSNVLAMTVLSTNLYVAGLFTNAGGLAASHIAKWDGSSWSAVGGGVVGSGSISALTTLGNNLYAGGSFTNIGGVPAAHIAKWDGTNWSALGSGTASIGPGSGAVFSLSVLGSDLYAGGNFRSAGNKSSYDIGRWNDQVNFNIPQIINPAWLGNGQFRMELYGIPGLTNIIQATTNLSSWVPVLTNSAGIYDFTDTSATNYLHRFYRATLGP